MTQKKGQKVLYFYKKMFKLVMNGYINIIENVRVFIKNIYIFS